MTFENSDVQQVVDSEATFAGFFAGCVEYPKYCPLARNESSAGEIYRKVQDLLQTIKYQPIVLGSDISTDLVDYGTIKGLILQSLYSTTLWPVLAQLLDSIFTGDQKSYVEAYTVISGALAQKVYPQYGLDALQGIRCSDSAFRADSLAEVLPLVNDLEVESPIIGDLQAASILLPCSRWKMSAKERYTGT